ncbi:hypothetical protein BDQ17DRAFT_1333694 [Cyathus striatus]|nr:hypothetical protein BDQ17DRAFT_1333694 [Cyathus striatus]
MCFAGTTRRYGLSKLGPNLLEVGTMEADYITNNGLYSHQVQHTTTHQRPKDPNDRTNLVKNSEGENVLVSLLCCRPEENDDKLEFRILEPKPGAKTFELVMSAKDDVGYEFHGVPVPRYYGWFNITLQEGHTFLGVESTGVDSDNHILSILVLERVGDRITMKESEDEIYIDEASCTRGYPSSKYMLDAKISSRIYWGALPVS